MSHTTDKLAKRLGDCPAWVQWLAQDADGTWWGYEVRPLPHDTGWYENEVGRCMRLVRTAPNPDWQHSLHAYGDEPPGAA